MKNTATKGTATKRRTFLSTSAALVGGLGLSFPMYGASADEEPVSWMPVADKAIHYFVQSGNYKQEQLVGIGLLEVSKENKIAKDLNDLATANGYRSEIKYKSNDRFKIDLCKAFIDYFVANDVKLYVKLIPNARTQFRELSPKAEQELKTDILSNLKGFGTNITKVKVKSESSYGPSKKFKESFEGRNNISYEAVRAKDDVLIQFADLLTGSVMACIKGGVASNVKNTLNQYLKDKLATTTISAGGSYKNKLFIV